jgi:hypothetical protein
MLTLNAHSLVNPSHFMHIKEILVHDDIDLCFVSETFANSEEKLLKIPGYNIVRSDRPTHGGEVPIIFKSEIKCNIISKTDFRGRRKSEHQPEFLFVSVKIRNFKPILLACVYRPPYAVNICEFKQVLKTIFNRI